MTVEERHRRLLAWSLVGVQAMLIAGVVIAPSGSTWAQNATTDGFGTACTLAALALGLWAAAYLGRGLTPSPVPNGASDLVVRGPYRWVRHPMYVAVMVFAIGAAVRSANWLTAALAAALVAFLVGKARWEESQLLQAFPGYREYAATTPRFIPIG